MAQYDLSVGGGNGLPAEKSGGFAILEKVVDCNETNRVATNELLLFIVPAGAIVRRVSAEILTAEGATLTFDVGDYNSAGTVIDKDGYIDGANGNAAGYAANIPGALVEAAPNTWNPAYALGKLYGAQSYIGVLLNNDAATAKIRFKARIELA